MQITWLGHSSFRIEIEQAVLLIDPWLNGNPMFPQDKIDAALAGVTHILVTHGHGDHASDVLAFARKTGATIATVHELAEWFQRQGAEQVTGFARGGTIDCGGAAVTMVAASHSSSVDFLGGDPVVAGNANGFMIAGEGEVIYLSGDTDLMADMDWMGDFHKPTIGILSCGGRYTMDMKRAAYAARRYFRFKAIIPCHYRTYPILAQSADDLRAGVPVGTKVIEPEVLTPITF